MFVNPTLEQVSATADADGLTMLQLHGQEGPVVLRRGGSAHGLQRDQGGARAQPRRHPGARRASTPTSICSTARSGIPGGTGETFAWELARTHPAAMPLILSGGLDPGNVAEAIADRAPVRRRRRQRRGERRPGARIAERCALRRGGRRGRSPTSQRDAGNELDGRTADRDAIEHRFGPYGGQYVPETLMPALASSRRRGSRPAPTRAFTGRLQACCETTSAGPRRCIWRRG